jgi:hypothetical protein
VKRSEKPESAEDIPGRFFPQHWFVRIIGPRK